MHEPVLLNEVIDYLNPRPGENFIDCTFGEAGHAAAVLERIKPDGRILGIDADFDSLKRIKPQDGLVLIQGNFKDLKKIIEKYDFYPVNGILFDLGLSSWQIEESNRGFTFRKDEILDMRFSPERQKLTAGEIINDWPEEKLQEIFRNYGEERYSGRIVRKIVDLRKTRPIETTFQLSDAIKNAVPFFRSRRERIDKILARIFQALRIAVNDELENLNHGLKQALEILEPEGRLVVISFHSLEDRIVKNFFREQQKFSFLKILTKKPVVVSKEEINKNPRSRSAKLRVAIKLA